jgi:hypothetical protein
MTLYERRFRYVFFLDSKLERDRRVMNFSPNHEGFGGKREYNRAATSKIYLAIGRYP